MTYCPGPAPPQTAHDGPVPNCPECGQDFDPTTDPNELEDAIVAFVTERGGSTLRGRFFDVGNLEGKRAYAEWLAGEITALNEYIEESNRG